MKRYYLLLILSFLMILSSCMPNYDIELSEISFDHEENFDIISFTAQNPTDYDLSCQVIIKLKNQEPIIKELEISSKEILNSSVKADFPNGESKVILTTRCKQII